MHFYGGPSRFVSVVLVVVFLLVLRSILFLQETYFLSIYWSACVKAVFVKAVCTFAHHFNLID
jgi:hypothetical protein